MRRVRSALVPAIPYVPLLLALALLLALPGTVDAGLTGTADRFSTTMRDTATRAAAGFFFGGLLLIGIGHFGAMPKFSGAGKGSAVFGVVLFLGQELYAFATGTARGLFGGG